LSPLNWCHDGVGTTKYTYSASGQLLTEDGSWSNDTVTNIYANRLRIDLIRKIKIGIYDGMRVIQERDGSNVPAVSYTRGTDLSGSMEGAGGIGGLLARSHVYSSGNWYAHNYYHADGGGNITYLLTSGQGLGASYRYDPFGNTISQSGTYADANVYRFSSKESVRHIVYGGIELYYYGYRFYAPNLQRWPNQDPIGERGGLNLYTYVGNDPLDRVDPLGLAYGNPVSGPSGPVGPSNPYAPGWPYYPNGSCYKPAPQKSIDPDCFKNCMRTWLGGNIWNYAAGLWGAGSVYAAGTAPVLLNGVPIPAGWVAGGYGGAWLGGAAGAGIGISVASGVVATGGVLAAAGAGWAAGTAIQCAANCYR